MTCFIRPFFVIFLTCLAACSGVDLGATGGDPNGGANDGSFKSQLTGNWRGHLVNKTVDEGSALRESAVVAEFVFSDETSGNFVITLPTIDNARAEGKFSDFAGKSLHLNIVKSTISTLGSTGSATSINYNIIGSDLELYNDRVSLQLIKGTGGSSTTAGDGTKPEPSDEDIAVGRWICNDKFSNSWRFNIKSKTAFSLDVFSGTGDAPGIWLDGSLALTVAANKSVSGSGQIVTSGNRDYIGMRLLMRFPNDAEMIVDQMKSKDHADTTVADSFICSKQ